MEAPRTDAPVRFIATRMGHHSDHAGYDQLTRYIPGTTVRPNRVRGMLDLVPERVLAQVRRSAGSWYNSAALKRELQNVPDFVFSSRRVYHFLYGEDTFHYSGYLNPRHSNKLVATYHSPPEKFLNINRGSRHLQRLDALVIVAPNQEELFKNMAGPERVHLIPHGVDAEFFSPGEAGRKTGKTCLFTGSHLRDFATLREVIMLLNKEAPEISFIAVTLAEHFRYFEGLKNTRPLSSISEPRLLELYRTSDLLLLPLLDATANNSILEAMACGLPVVTTGIGGIPFYLPPEAGLLLPPAEPQIIARVALALLADAPRRTRMSIAGRRAAESLDWSVVARQFVTLYTSLYS